METLDRLVSHRRRTLVTGLACVIFSFTAATILSSATTAATRPEVTAPAPSTWVLADSVDSRNAQVVAFVGPVDGPVSGYFEYYITNLQTLGVTPDFATAQNLYRVPAIASATKLPAGFPYVTFQARLTNLVPAQVHWVRFVLSEPSAQSSFVPHGIVPIYYRRGSVYLFRSIASEVGLAPSPQATIQLRVTSSSRRVCSVNSRRQELRMTGLGICQVTIEVNEGNRKTTDLFELEVRSQ